MTIGEKIVKLRKRNGMSQESFSEKLGVSRQAISKWENDTAQPTSENLAQIAKLFNVSISSLLIGATSTPFFLIVLAYSLIGTAEIQVLLHGTNDVSPCSPNT